jgi:nondiscriminating glutamyl-tRNA synthetase
MMRLRFAPSPTGYLHVGNARTALFNWLLARKTGGRFVLRIEDTDVERSTTEAEASILEDLRWLGLAWDEGPDVGGPHGPYRQSERKLLYEAHANRLLGSGQAYRCFCTPEQLDAERMAAVAAGRPVQYSGRCRNLTPADLAPRLSSGERFALRFRVPEGREIPFEDVVRGTVRFSTEVIGDPVILRSDGTPAYNFAVVVDDALMQITHVIRGEDHISNTPRQLLLYEALGFPAPVFAHLALVMGPDHSPLSKRHGATSVAEFRAKGYLPEALVNYLALIGWSPREHGTSHAAGGATSSPDTELVPVDELVRRFSLEAVGLSPGVFDEEKLAWVNRHYLKSAEPSRLARLAVEFFRAAGRTLDPDDDGLRFLADVMPIASGAVDRLDQIPPRLSFLFDFDPAGALTEAGIRQEVTEQAAIGVLRAFADALADAPRLDRDRFRAVAAQVRSTTGQRGKSLFHPIRLALTARPEGPELDLIVPAIDQGAGLPPNAGLPAILGCRERARAFADAAERVS